VGNFLKSWQLQIWSRNSLLLWIPKVHYFVHESLPLDSILSHSNPVHTPKHPVSLRSILIVCPIYTLLSQAVFSLQVKFSFPPWILHSLHHFILLDSITLTISDKLFKLWSSSLCNFLQPPVTLFLYSQYCEYKLQLFAPARGLSDSFISSKTKLWQIHKYSSVLTMTTI